MIIVSCISLLTACDTQHIHSAGKWEVTLEPTCSECGEKSLLCKTCGEVMDSEVLYPVGHSFVGGLCSYCGTRVSENLKFTSNGDGTCSVSGIGSCLDSLLVIPEYSPSGERVTSIRKFAFDNCTTINEVVIPDSVAEIGESAFEGCSELVSVTLGDGVRNIGSRAFLECSALFEITFGNNVSLIDYDAFGLCTALCKVHIPDIASWCKIRFSYLSANPLHANGDLFIDGEEVRDLVIPKNVFNINEYAFYGSDLISSVYIPDTVTRIGAGAFAKCRSIISISVPFLGENRSKSEFERFGYIFDIDGAHTANQCVPTSLKTVELRNEVIIQTSAFYDCIGIESIILPPTLKTIEFSAFEGCFSLREIDIPQGVTTIGNSAFRNCENLTSITIPGSVSVISPLLFTECYSLTEVIFNEGVREIGAWVFESCPSLSILSLPNSLEKIESFTLSKFDGSPNMEYTEFDNALYIGNDSNPYIVLVEASDTAITSCNIHPETRFIGGYAFSECKSLSNITFTDKIVSIGDHAFNGCTSLTSLAIPANVKRVEQRAFTNCTGITDLFISEGVEKIGNAAFSSCSSLKAIDIPDSVVLIETHAFSHCTALTDVSIGSGVKILPYNMFTNCDALESIIIPATVIEIGAMIFQYCDSIKSVKIENASTCRACGVTNQHLGDTKNFTEAELSAPDKVAEYLTGDYCGFVWHLNGH